MKRIFIRPKASSDLDEQALFIAKDNVEAAYRLYKACEQTLNTLAKMPQMGQKYATGNDQLKGVRFFPIADFRKHLIFYIPTKEKIEVVRILYGTRNVNRILQGEASQP